MDKKESLNTTSSELVYYNPFDFVEAEKEKIFE